MSPLRICGVRCQVENRSGNLFARADPTDWNDRNDLIANSSLAKRSNISVAITPGAIALIRMFYFANLSATDFVKPSTACLDAM
jgi:hypothetical protein